MSTPDRLCETVEFYAAAPAGAIKGNQTAEFLRDEIQRHNVEREQQAQDS